MIKKSLLMILCLLVILSVVFAGGQREPADPDAEPAVHMRFGAAGLGSSWYVYAASIAEMLRPQLPRNSTIDIIQGGGVGNAILVAEKRAEVALTHLVTAKWAMDGTVIFDEPQDNFKALVGTMDTYYIVPMFTKASGITSMRQLVEEKPSIHLMTVPRGGNGELGALHILEAYGIDYDTIREWGGRVTHTSRPGIASAIKDGHADGWIHIVTPGHPTVAEIAAGVDMNYLTLDEDVVAELQRKYGYMPSTIPSQALTNRQNEELLTIEAPTTLVASAELPEEVAYMITKIICENVDSFIGAHAGLAGFKPEEVAWKHELNWAPLHPGAERYYRERGWID